MLVQRLSLMNTEMLTAKLGDDSAEIRRAAASACVKKGEVALTPRLISLIGDPDARVAAAAYASLKTLTGRDFGPPAEATAPQRAQAATAWQAWWARRVAD